MESKVGFGFRPTDEELVGHYIINKIMGKTELVDSVNVVDICRFDPWNLLFQAKIISSDRVWYFFNEYLSGNRVQSRKTPSGYWKITGKPVDVVGQWGTPQGKIGYKKVLGFHTGKSNGAGCDWVIHEYHTTLFPELQMTTTWTLCKLMFKGNESEFSSYYSGGEVDLGLVNSVGGTCTDIEVGTSSFELLPSQELLSLSQLSGGGGFLDGEEETQLQYALPESFDNIWNDDFNRWFDYDAEL